jgi:hypothetical protein
MQANFCLDGSGQYHLQDLSKVKVKLCVLLY